MRRRWQNWSPITASARTIAEGGRPRRASAISRAASCCRASASTGCSIPARPFLELAPLAAHEMYERPDPCRRDHHRDRPRLRAAQCMIVCNDATVKGGTYYPLTVKKHLRAQEIARENRLALHLSRRFRRRQPAATRPRSFPTATISAASSSTRRTCRRRASPQIACVMGSCTAGGAYVPAMSDESVIVRKQGTIFLGGPPLVKAATGEEVSAEELGGGDVHARKSGVADHYAEDDAMRWRSCATSSRAAAAAGSPRWRSPSRRRRAMTRQTSTASSPPILSRPYDVHEVIARLVDGCEFDEFKQLYGGTLVCGFAQICGMPVGILANNGILFSEFALKGAHFIELACQRKIPLLFLQNISGFMVGRKYEAGGIAKRRRQAGDRRRLRRACRRSRCSSAAPSARGITACAAEPITRASFLPGRTRASR